MMILSIASSIVISASIEIRISSASIKTSRTKNKISLFLRKKSSFLSPLQTPTFDLTTQTYLPAASPSIRISFPLTKAQTLSLLNLFLFQFPYLLPFPNLFFPKTTQAATIFLPLLATAQPQPYRRLNNQAICHKQLFLLLLYLI